MEELDQKKIIKELMIDAKAVGIPTGAAEIFIDHVMKNLKSNFKDKKIVTKGDIERYIAKELKKYNTDLAYVQIIRDKII